MTSHTIRSNYVWTERHFERGVAPGGRHHRLTTIASLLPSDQSVYSVFYGPAQYLCNQTYHRHSGSLLYLRTPMCRSNYHRLTLNNPNGGSSRRMPSSGGPMSFLPRTSGTLSSPSSLPLFSTTSVTSTTALSTPPPTPTSS